MSGLWGRYLRDVLGPVPVPSDLTGPGRALAAALEDGSLEQVQDLCRGTELEPRELGLLLARADKVCRVWWRNRDFEDKRDTEQGVIDRVRRMSMFKLFRLRETAEVAEHLSRSPLDDGAVADALASRDRAWLDEFARHMVRHSRFGLVLMLVRRFGSEVEPTRSVAAECLEHHMGQITSVKESDTVIGERLRHDPLAAGALPALQVRGDDGVSHYLGDHVGYRHVRFAAERVISVAVEQGLIDRPGLVNELVAGLRSDDYDDRIRVDGYVSLLEHLAPTDEELATFLELWAGLSTTVGGMNKRILGRAVTTLAREGRLPDGQVAQWLRVLREEHSGLAANAVTALTVLADDRRYLTDEQAADVLRLVADGQSGKATAAMTCVQAFLDAGRLTGEQITDCAREVLFRPERGLVNAMIKLLGRMLRDDAGRVVALAPALAAAFSHPSADTQEKALTLADRHHDRLDDNARTVLAEAAEHLVPALRERASQVFGGTCAAESSSYEETLPPVTAPERLAPPTSDLGEAVADLAVWLRGGLRDPARWERALDDLVRHAHRDRTALAEALAPVLKSCGWHPEISAWQLAGMKRLLVASALTAGDTPHPVDVVTDELIARRDDWSTHSGCGRQVFDQVFRARMNELWHRIMDHDVPPLLLATPTWSDGTIAPEELVDRLATYEALAARPGTADFDQALLRVRHDDTAATAADRADTLGLPEARRLANWLRTGGLTAPSTTRRVHAVRYPHYREDLVRCWEQILDDAGMPTGFSETFRRLTDPFVADCGTCLWDIDRVYGQFSLPLLLSVLPAHREIVAARTLTAFAGAAETDSRSAAGDLPSLVDTDVPVGAAVHLALAYGLGARRAPERVAAADAMLIMAARGSLDAARLGDDLAELVTHGILKAGRVTESLSSAAQAGAHLTVGAVLAAALPALLPEPGAKPPAGLAELLTLTAECAETTRQLPPVKGIAELATRKGSSLYAKAARRLHAACTPPA
ncbi:DUF6493 family protein [Streptomyces sp. NPDC057301]|uniref:DUF7824 domain-containing protein n=1 Tax=Streptomyces sp. NPDC057301 TaxID=3346093 RepID=UPI003639E570